MRFKIVLVPFPFDDLTGEKVRPVRCLAAPLGSCKHVVVAFITSSIRSSPERSDIQILPGSPHFQQTGLRVPWTIRLPRIIAITTRLILRNLGTLPRDLQSIVQERLREFLAL